MAADYRTLTHAPHGRDSTHPSFQRIARWVAGRLQRRGLRPAGDGHGSKGLRRYLQRFSWDQRFTRAKGSSSNVIGVLPGDGSTNEAVLVIAHLDGLSAAQKRGIEQEARRNGRQIDMSRYQGANDNGSAVATALYISDALGRLQRRRGKPLRRDVVFLFPSAEEEGLKGTEAFARFSKQFGNKRFVAAVNFEMVGRGNPRRVRLFGGENGLEASANPVFGLGMGLKTKGNMAQVIPGHHFDQGQGWFRRSDHFITSKAGIPSVMYLGKEGDYHTPKDSLAQIDLKTTKAVARHALRLVSGLASDPGPISQGSTLPKNVSNHYEGQVYPGSTQGPGVSSPAGP